MTKKLTEREKRLLDLIKIFDKNMTMINEKPSCKSLFYQLPPSMLDLWHECAETITSLTGEKR